MNAVWGSGDRGGGRGVARDVTYATIPGRAPIPRSRCHRGSGSESWPARNSRPASHG